MDAWIIYFRDQAVYNRQYIQFYIEEGMKLRIDIKLIIVEELTFGVKNNHWFMKYQNSDISFPDFAIVRAIYPLLSRQLELLGIRVFNNSFVSEICNDKARTYQYLAKTGIKMVDSSFYKNFQIENALSQTKYPSVIKTVDGHGGSQVFMVEGENEDSKDKAQIPVNTGIVDDTDIIENTDNTIVKGLGSSDVVLQPLTGNRHQDLRVYVIGTKIIAAVLRTAKEGFKSNFSLGGEVCLYELTESEKEVINIIIEQFDFGLVGIDFIIGDEGELIFNEIEDVVGSRMLYQCSNINIVREYLNYIISLN